MIGQMMTQNLLIWESRLVKQDISLTKNPLWLVTAPGTVVRVGYTGQWADILWLLIYLTPQAAPIETIKMDYYVPNWEHDQAQHSQLHGPRRSPHSHSFSYFLTLWGQALECPRNRWGQQLPYESTWFKEVTWLEQTASFEVSLEEKADFYHRAFLSCCLRFAAQLPMAPDLLLTLRMKSLI